MGRMSTEPISFPCGCYLKFRVDYLSCLRTFFNDCSTQKLAGILRVTKMERLDSLKNTLKIWRLLESSFPGINVHGKNVDSRYS